MTGKAYPRVDPARALKEAGVAALLAVGLFLPLIGFNTVQDIRNVIVLETRFGLLLLFVAVITAASLLNSFVLAPARARRVLRARPRAPGRAPRPGDPWPG